MTGTTPTGALVAALLSALEQTPEALDAHPALLDALAERLTPRLAATQQPQDEWLDTKGAAAYGATTTHALHKATADGSVQFEQDRPGGKCYFKRPWIDAWRQGERPPLGSIHGSNTPQRTATNRRATKPRTPAPTGISNTPQ